MHFKRFSTSELILILCIVLGIFLKFLWLDKFPVGMSNDELEYILSSKTYALYGKDLSGFRFPESLFFNQTEGVISAIPPLIISPFYLFVPLNQLTARIPYLAIYLFTAWGIFLLTKILTKNKTISLLSVLLFLVSPWGNFLSHNTVDSTFALFFYTFAIVSFLILNGKSLIIPILLFLLGFLSYHGAKPILLPLFLICLSYRLFLSNYKIGVKESIAPLLGIVIIITSYFLINYFQPNSILSNKSQDLFLVETNTVASLVNDLRRTTIDTPLKDIFINKIVVSGQMLFNRYMQAFSTDILFVSGDPRATYKFGEFGLLYYFDFVLIILGIIYMYKENKNNLLFLILILLIAPISTALNKIEVSVINRSFMMLPILMIFSGIGAYYLFLLISNKIGKRFTTLAMLSVFLLSILNFYHFYFFTFPIKGQEAYLFSEKILTRFLKIDPNQKTIVVTEKPRSAYFRAIFYSDQKLQEKLLAPNYPIPEINSYTLGNVEYTSTCPTEISPEIRYIVSRKVDKCLNDLAFDYSITDQKDAGDIFKIYNNTTCANLSIDRWKRFHNINDYNIENLDDNSFCKMWIANTTTK